MIRAATLAETLKEMAAEDESGLDRFLAYLKARNLLPLLPAIVRILGQEEVRERDKRRVTISTPFSLSSASRKGIREKVGAPKEAEEEITLDSDLIGGFVAEYNYTQYDASMRRKLEELRNHLLH